MITFKTTCDNCGDIEEQMDNLDMGLRLEPNMNVGIYLFTCPTCHERQSRVANERVVSVLKACEVPTAVDMTDIEVTMAVEDLLTDLGLM